MDRRPIDRGAVPVRVEEVERVAVAASPAQKRIRSTETIKIFREILLCGSVKILVLRFPTTGKKARKWATFALGKTIHNLADTMRTTCFDIVATFAEFEAAFIRMGTCEGMATAKAKGKL